MAKLCYLFSQHLLHHSIVLVVHAEPFAVARANVDIHGGDCVVLDVRGRAVGRDLNIEIPKFFSIFQFFSFFVSFFTM